MGQIIDAHCKQCGYSDGVGIGGGRSDFQIFSAWPAYCNDCSSLVSVNTRKYPICCFKCKSENVTQYGDPKLSDNTGDNAASWGDDTLKNGGHFCPNCRKRTLEFGGIGRRRLFFD